MTVREARAEDLQPLLNLYTHLHNNPVPEIDSRLLSLWERILNDPDHHILLADADGQIAASCVVLIVPNLTNGQQAWVCHGLSPCCKADCRAGGLLQDHADDRCKGRRQAAFL